MFNGADFASGGTGGGGNVDIDGGSVPEENDERSAEAGATGCENGFPGPFGASVNVWATVEPGAETGVYDCAETGGISALFRASDIDGSEFVPLGDSFSSLVDRLELDSGGEM